MPYPQIFYEFLTVGVTMLPMRDTDFIYRILCIDNGSTHLGIVILDLDVRDGTYNLIHDWHVDASKSQRVHDASYLGEKSVRMKIMEDAITDTLAEWVPDAVAVEAPFFQPGRVQSFAVLKEMMVLIKRTVERYDETLFVYEVSPGEAKRAVWTSTEKFSMKKEQIPEHVIKYKKLKSEVDILNLSEHCYDAVAVGISHGEWVRKALRFSST